MKKEKQNQRGSSQAPYISPDAKNVEISVQRMLCESTEQYEYEDDYNPWKD